ncbi:DNA primase subunit pri2 [Lithohypha guttulata]|uniref:DNA primase large subunit n=1 Tax=Lithohypha guttulata TaxID=1690604 RepID=A0AAN7Y7G9_9EURO|nr:DNA primase subunit pri2 [Lithohypha guttulata]
MIRSGIRPEIKKKRIDHKKTQFAKATFQEHDYQHRLSLYDFPPTAEISIEEFETWAIDRLRILAELESCSFRNRSPQETAVHMEPLLKRYMPLSNNSATGGAHIDERLKEERKKDHYSHWILRLAFCRTEDLRRRFSRIETTLFRMRFQQDDGKEKRAFIDSLNLHWETVSNEEKTELSEHLLAATPSLKRVDDENFFKVDWTSIPDLIEHRSVFVRKGKAYVPTQQQTSMIITQFTQNLDKALELSARALPRIDEDDRLSPILDHLSKNFATPDAGFHDTDSSLSGAPINAANVDNLSQHFPLCMKNLHTTLRKNDHLKHFGRLQYTLFLKGIGLSLDDCLIFWRQAFKKIDDDKFNKEYRYNVRHVYGDVGGDANRRGRGYSPYSCQKILTEHPPGTNEAHGCPYRHFNIDNLTSMLQATGVHDREVLRGVKEDVEKKRYHIACNRVFEWAHKVEIKRVKDDNIWGPAELDTIVHPNTYFKRSYLLKNLNSVPKQDVKMEDS